MGRAMGDQDIDVRRYQVPLLAKLCAALEVEGGNGGAKLVHGSGGIVSLRAEQNSAT